MQDNGSFSLKQALRERVAQRLAPDARILEVFAGEGRIYRACWARFPCGATMDLDEQKARAAARERPTWSVYSGNAMRALRAGWMGHVPFDVVDLDCWGAPWVFLQAMILSKRAWAPKTTVLLTDGVLPNFRVPCKIIFGDGKRAERGMTVEVYRETVLMRLREWTAGTGLEAASLQTVSHSTGKKVGVHLLELAHAGE